MQKFVSNMFLGLFFTAFVCSGIFSVKAIADSGPSQFQNEETWNSIKGDLFDENKPILDGSAFLELDAPYRAHDAAVVPIKITTKPGVTFKSITLVIDENPAPMAAAFSFGPASVNQSFSTRVRINSYSYVRAVGETDDGRVYMVKTFIKAAGGCSAPASKDMASAKKSIGKMKFRQFSVSKTEPAMSSSSMREAQIMIRHPNFSGLQMNQVTMLYIPAHFVDDIEVRLGDDLLMRVEGGISLSENPNIRFFYRPNGASEISVRAHDTEQEVFSKSWPVDAGS